MEPPRDGNYFGQVIPFMNSAGAITDRYAYDAFGARHSWRSASSGTSSAARMAG